jgi:hypothetical protein
MLSSRSSWALLFIIGLMFFIANPLLITTHSLQLGLQEPRRQTMPASKTTVDDVVRVLLKHLDAATLKKVVRDLLDVKGTASFEKTIATLWNRVKDLS